MWRRRGQGLLGLVCLLVAWSASSPAWASEQWKVVVMGLSHAGTITPDHPAYDRVENALSKALIDHNYSVFSKAQAGLDFSCRDVDCENLSAAALMEQTERVKNQFDLLVTYRVFVVREPGAAFERFKVRFEGLIIDLHRKEIVNVWEQPAQVFIGSPDNIGDDARREREASDIAVQAADASVAVVSFLQRYKRSYLLDLQGFTVRDMDRLSHHIRQRDDYRRGDLRKLRFGEPRRQGFHRITDARWRYKAPLSLGALEGVLRQYAREAGIGDLLITENGTLQLRRASLPFLVWYVVGMVVLLLVLLTGFVAYRFQRDHRAIRLLAEEHRANAGLRYLKSAVPGGVPLPKTWQAQKSQWQEEAQAAEVSLQTAERAIDSFKLDEASAALQDVLSVDADNAKALEYQSLLPAWKKALTQVSEAKQCLDQEPETALHLLGEADGVFPRLAKPIAKLRQLAEQGLRDNLLTTCEQSARAALAENRPYHSLAAVDRALAALAELRGFDGDESRFESLRREAISLVHPINGAASGTEAWAGVTVLLGSKVSLGRVSQSSPADIAIGYKRISRAGRQCQLRFNGQQFYLDDQHSANGTWLGARLLEPGENAAITGPTTVTVGGARDENRPGLCQMSVKWGAHDQHALTLSFSQTVVNLLDATSMTTAWSTIEEDITKRWICLQGRVAVGIVGDILDIGCHLGSEPVAFLYRERLDGQPVLAIEPADPQGQRVTVNGAQIASRVPLDTGAVITIDALQGRLTG